MEVEILVHILNVMSKGIIVAVDCANGCVIILDDAMCGSEDLTI